MIVRKKKGFFASFSIKRRKKANAKTHTQLKKPLSNRLEN